MKPPRLWRYRPAAAPACGTQPPPVPVPGTAFRFCRSCDVEWHGTGVCWCCGTDVSMERGGATTPPRKSPSQ